MRTAIILSAAALSTSVPAQEDHQDNTEAHHHGVVERGEQRMGFDQQTTNHHFVLLSDGGLVRVQANSGQDEVGIGQIRGHLREIRDKFSKGDFEAPEFIHSQTPPGVSVMQQQKASIRYAYKPVNRGAELRISSKNPKAVAAIHDFLKFQITDHKTGDFLQIRR